MFLQYEVWFFFRLDYFGISTFIMKRKTNLNLIIITVDDINISTYICWNWKHVRLYFSFLLIISNKNLPFLRRDQYTFDHCWWLTLIFTQQGLCKITFTQMVLHPPILRCKILQLIGTFMVYIKMENGINTDERRLKVTVCTSSSIAPKQN